MNFKDRIQKIKLVAFDFDGVFTDNHVYIDEDGRESVRCWRGDGIGLRKLEKLGIKCVVISGESNPVVRHRCNKLRIECFSGVEDKLAKVKALHENLEEVAFVGNDLNDLACLKAVGFPVVACNAHGRLYLAAKYITKIDGGRGAVREICELIEDNHV